MAMMLIRGIFSLHLAKRSAGFTLSRGALSALALLAISGPWSLLSLLTQGPMIRATHGSSPRKKCKPRINIRKITAAESDIL